MNRQTDFARTLSRVIALISMFAASACSPGQDGSTRQALAQGGKLSSLELNSKHMKWEEPTEPFTVVGPLHFVGTIGLMSWLFATPEGHILLNTGMPSSGPMIVDSIRKLGFEPEDVEFILNGHAHIDHAGAIAYMKQVTGAQLAVMDGDVQAIEDGGKSDFQYADDWETMGFPPARVDRVLRDGDTIQIGEITLTAHHTPGHTRGSTTWVAKLTDAGRPYTVVFADGAGFNPGYRLEKEPSYPGIGDDFRRTLHTLETLKPDIWAAAHPEPFDFSSKRERARAEGVRAWVDPDGYRRFIDQKRRAFEDQVDVELGMRSAQR